MPVVAALDYHHTVIVVRMRHNTINNERKKCLVIQEINFVVTQCYAPLTAYTRVHITAVILPNKEVYCIFM